MANKKKNKSSISAPARVLALILSVLVMGSALTGIIYLLISML